MTSPEESTNDRTEKSPYHRFNVYVAAEIGMARAVILENIHFWIMKNQEEGRNLHEGRYWTYNSAEAFAEVFPYMTSRQINYYLNDMVKKGILLAGNFNTFKYDRTLWYTTTDFAERILRNRDIDSTKSWDESNETVEPIPFRNPYVDSFGNSYVNGAAHPPSHDETVKSKGEKKQPKKKAKKKPTVVRHKYGEYQNVLLSDEDMATLQAEFPYDWQDRIERLSGYMASKGATYKNHLATIRTWARNDKKKAAGQQYKPVDRWQQPYDPSKYSQRDKTYDEMNDEEKAFYDEHGYAMPF